MNEALKAAKEALFQAYKEFNVANKNMAEATGIEARKKAAKELQNALDKFQIAQKKYSELQLMKIQNNQPKKED